MKSLGYIVSVLLVLVVFLGGCMQPSYVPAPPTVSTSVPVTPVVQNSPTPCASCYPTPAIPTTMTTEGISQAASPTTLSLLVPIAEFSANTTSGRSPLAIGFSDRSSLSPANWSWSFGDGSLSHEKNPIHVYLVPGTYSVSLNASNAAGGSTATKVYFITVMPAFQAPVASFELAPQGAPSGIIQFVDRSYGPPTNWSWDFGDGTTSSLENPHHSFATPGNYLVSMKVSNPAGTSVATRELVFGGGP